MNNILEFKKQELKLLENSNFSNQNPMRFLKWFLKNAQSFTKVDLKKSEEVSVKTDSQIKMCYHNCWKALLDYRKFRYFEGFVWSKELPLPLEHSWLVDTKGRVIDPTLIINAQETARQMKKKYGIEDHFKRQFRIGDEYLGIEFPYKKLNKLVFQYKRTGSFLPELFLSGEI
ncbi:MAG: hypothetical protein GTN97_05905 [Nitrosopumilaceae archaeon]|nr:hypothetical protein [Nitrosopumilaceae archaeon]